MRARFGLSIMALALVACSPQAPPPVATASAPDAIYYGATIYTGVDGAPTVEAVSVKDGKVVSVGKSGELLKTAGAATQKVELKGVFLYPGFTDAHVHLRGVGEREMTLNLDKIGSIAELKSAVAEAIKPLKPGEVLVGRGWIETHWPEKRFPNRQDLDGVSGDHPMLLERADGHALVANSAALKAAGIDGRNERQPDGGRIEVDKTGLPTGMLIDNAMSLVGALVPKADGAWIDKAYETAATRELSLGWTGGHNMSVEPSDVAHMKALSASGKFQLRVYNALDTGGMGGKLDPATFSHEPGALITTRAIKLYMDGALGSRGAWLSGPYSDMPSITGLQRSHAAETLPLLKQAYDLGVQVSFHAIGDQGNSQVLDWYQQTFATVGDAEKAKRDPRWRIEHAQVLKLADIPRFKALGVIPSMQPSHAIGDLYFAPARLGPERLKGAYAWRSLIDAGAIIAGGSDAPVEQGDPRIEFYAAVARKDLKGNAGADWHPEQKVTRAEALKMFTVWPAYASFREKELGTIEPGKLADFSGYSGDLMTIPEAEILTVKPMVTVVGGAVRFQAK
jgi:predicted amidohydrolase YtcJ